MTNGPNPSNIGDALGQALDAVKAGQQAQEAIADKTTQAEAADGRVIATASLNGKVNVEITNVRAYRLEPAQLAAEITRAVNEALDAARDQAAAPADVDLGELSAKLEEIQQQSAKQLQSFMSSLTETHAGVLRAASEGRERP